MTVSHKPLALVLGATGGIGGAVAERLLAEGWNVRAMNRDPDKARTVQPALDWIKGDAMVAAEVVAAAQGTSIIFHGVNPPGYKNWEGLQMPMLASTVAAARATGARILFPGTVYNYGPDAFPLITEASAQTPITSKGAVRVKMEAALRAASDEGVRVLILRLGDFFGPRPGNNWLSQGLVKPGQPVRAVTYPGAMEIPHALAYLPDAAETFVRLLDTELANFEHFAMQGQQINGHELVAALEQVTGRKLPVRKLPWMALAAISPFNETMREMLEMRYLWDRPVLMDNTRLVKKLGAEPLTPLADALYKALVGLGCLNEDAVRNAA